MQKCNDPTTPTASKRRVTFVAFACVFGLCYLSDIPWSFQAFLSFSPVRHTYPRASQFSVPRYLPTLPETYLEHFDHSSQSRRVSGPKK